MNFRRILVAVDFRPPSLRAVRWAREYAGPATRVDVVWVLPHGNEGDQDRAMDALEGFATTLAPARPELHVRVGEPRRAIGRLIDELDADLLVLGRNLAGGNDGQTSEQLLRHARVPVLVVGTDGATRPKRVLVGLDDPAGSRMVLGSALAVARHFRAELTIANVIAPPLVGSHRSGAVRHPDDDGDIARARDLLLAEAVRAAAPDDGESGGASGGVRVRTEVRRGDPAAQLLAITQRAPVDLVVIGRSGRGSVAPLGSVTRHLARVAPMSVLVVPRTLRSTGKGKRTDLSGEGKRAVRADSRGHAVGGRPRDVVRHARNVTGSEYAGHARFLPGIGPDHRPEWAVIHRTAELVGERACHPRARSGKERIERHDGTAR